jgi:iron-sulfur cluster assembly protein
MAIQVTPAARSELLRFLAALAASPASPQTSSPAPSTVIRLSATAGGCSGWSYQLAANPSPIDGDRLLQFEQLELRIDPESWPLLETLSLDYSEDLMGGSFRFSNPSASQVCRCGQSFAPRPATNPTPHLEAVPADSQYMI